MKLSIFTGSSPFRNGLENIQGIARLILLGPQLEFPIAKSAKVNYILYKRAQSHPILRKSLSYKYLYSLSSGSGYATRERLFSSVPDQVLSVIGRILPSKIDSIVKKFWSVIVRNFYNFCTIQSVPAAKNMDKSEGSSLLTIETLKTFHCCIEKSLFGMNPTHSVPTLQRSTKLQ